MNYKDKEKQLIKELNRCLNAMLIGNVLLLLGMGCSIFMMGYLIVKLAVILLGIL